MAMTIPVLKVLHTWDTNGRRPSSRLLRKKGHEVVSGVISSTVLASLLFFCAFCKTKVFANIQVPPRDHILTAFCSSSLLVLREDCNCCFFFCYLHFSPRTEEEGQGGSVMAIKYYLRVVGWKAVSRLPMPACPSQETANGWPFTELEQAEQY